MPKQIIINKLPSYLDTANLKPGDILVFRAYSATSTSITNSTPTPNRFAQSFVNAGDGESESKHVGVCIQDPSGELKLAHLRFGGFRFDPVQADILKSTIHVFRPKNPGIFVHTLSNLILNDQAIQKQAWSKVSALSSLFSALTVHDSSARLNRPQGTAQSTSFSSSAICSQFVVEGYHIAANQHPEQSEQLRRDFMNVRANIPPKELHAYLYRNSNYDYFIIPHAKELLLEKIKSAFTAQLAKLDDDDVVNELAHQEIKICQAIQNESDILRKTILYLQKLLALLEKDHATIAFALRNAALSQGIRSEYLDFEYVFSDDLAALAQQHYGYDAAQAKIYSDARKLGLSDAEAKVEVTPSVLGWMAANPVKTGLSMLTVLPFLTYVLPVASAVSQVAGERLERTRAVMDGPAVEEIADEFGELEQQVPRTQ